LFEEDREAGELHEAKEVLRIKLPADKDAALSLNPSEEPFGQPAPRISPKSASILRGARNGAVLPISMPSSKSKHNWTKSHFVMICSVQPVPEIKKV
jgi:hypothetical protein